VTAQAGVAEARAAGHANSLCLILADGLGPLAVETGDWVLAEELAGLVIDVAERHALSLWLACGRGLRGRLLACCGAAAGGAALLRTAIDGLSDGVVGVRYTLHLGWLAEALAETGAVDEAIAMIDEALRRCRQNEERWCVPELLRIKGRVLARTGEAATAPAEDALRQAIEEARRQGALSWELRAALCLAQLHVARGEGEAARALVAPVYARFTEGFDTADLVAARALTEARR
jgi:predicted ATPase